MAKVELTRVVFEYSDGTKKYLTEQELEKWMVFNSLVASCARLHNMDPDWDSIKWKTEGKHINY